MILNTKILLYLNTQIILNILWLWIPDNNVVYWCSWSIFFCLFSVYFIIISSFANIKLFRIPIWPKYVFILTKCKVKPVTHALPPLRMGANWSLHEYIVVADCVLELSDFSHMFHGRVYMCAINKLRAREYFVYKQAQYATHAKSEVCERQSAHMQNPHTNNTHLIHIGIYIPSVHCVHGDLDRPETAEPHRVL